MRAYSITLTTELAAKQVPAPKKVTPPSELRKESGRDKSSHVAVESIRNAADTDISGSTSERHPMRAASTKARDLSIMDYSDNQEGEGMNLHVT